MYQKKQKYTDIVIFSQWSRKSYAVFASLKKVVRIACLSIDICQSSLMKVPAIVRLFLILGESDIENEDAYINDEIDNLLLTQVVIPVISTSSDIYSQNKLQYGKPIFCLTQGMGFFIFKHNTYD